ncbi:MAG: hypothetical protein RI990_566 [Planctomycetota bacterium]
MRQATASVGPASIRVAVAGRELDIAVPPGVEAGSLRRRILAWLAGAPDGFGDVPLPAGTTFQRACWQACRNIPPGEVRTYGWLAAAAGSPRAVRAAGQAMRRNPCPIVVPCHRVVGASGRLGGYGGSEAEDAAVLKLALQRAESGQPDHNPRTIDRPPRPRSSRT